MFDDDSWDDEADFGGQEELLKAYEDIKNGQSSRILDEEEYEYIIDYFSRNNKEADAIQACELALTYFPYSVSLLSLKAEVLFQAQRYGQALQALDEVDKLSGNRLEAILLRSDIYLAQFKLEDAIQLLKENLPNFEGNEKVELMLELSDVYDESKNFEAVYFTLEEVLKTAPDNEEALHKISFWADIAGLQKNSVALHKKLTELQPFNALAWFNLGTALQGLKKYKEAIDAYEFCVAIDEKMETAYRNMADAYLKLNWYEKAIESLEKNLELGKPEDVIYEAMGHCFERIKNYTKARYFYQEALRLNPADDIIFFRIGETYKKEGEWQKAAKSYSTALSLNKNNASYLQSLGNCLLEMDVQAEALTCFLSAIHLRPGNKSNWTALFKCLYRCHKLEEMLDETQEAKEVLGDKPDFHYYAALALFAMGKAKEGLLRLETGLSQMPKKIKIILETEPDLLQRKDVVALVAKYKKQNL